MPETCGWPNCKRKCEHFWGEVGDNWACHGHYIIMQSNRDSYDLPRINEETFNKEDPVCLAWVARRKEGIKWLKEHPNEPTESLS